MILTADCHLHTSFSADSDAPMEEMVLRGISLGLKTMCFTEHMDYGMCSEGLVFQVDTDAYRKEYERLRHKYEDQIELLFGIELGLEPKIKDFLESYVKSWDFDFVIGSSHLVDGMDPYYPDFFEGRSEEASYRRYFETIPENLSAFSDVDTYGHLDYVVRYGPNKDQFYSFEKYADIIIPALKAMIEKGIGLEVNSAGLKYGLGYTNPHPDVLKAYLSLGGEIITIGSDAHTMQHVAWEFSKVKDMLLSCGCRYYTVFRGRKPTFVPID